MWDTTLKERKTILTEKVYDAIDIRYLAQYFQIIVNGKNTKY